MQYLNTSAYKFIELSDLPTLQSSLKSTALQHNLLGTILLSHEGINIMICGLANDINSFKNWLAMDARFNDLSYKDSYSEIKTFQKLFVKIKKEIIAFGVASIDPVQKTANYVKPQQLKQWLDERRDVVLLDTRNDYEITQGKFENAMDLNIQHFRDFPEAAKQLGEELKNKTIVTYCTGGIRCEKAALLLDQYGFKNTYQLEGGILKYFQECGNAHYEGNCYVFDERVTVSP